MRHLNKSSAVALHNSSNNNSIANATNGGAPSPFVAKLTDNVETQRYIARLEDELVELEAELLWASGPLLEESEQLQGENERLRHQNHEIVRMLEAARADVNNLKAELAIAQEKADVSDQRLKIVIPVAVCALVLAVWAWARRE